VPGKDPFQTRVDEEVEVSPADGEGQVVVAVGFTGRVREIRDVLENDNLRSGFGGGIAWVELMRLESRTLANRPFCSKE
jgi:hypothetical protein